MSRASVLSLCLTTALACIATGVFAGSQELALDDVINDSRNEGIVFSATEKDQALWFCVDDISELKDSNDVFRIFLQTASSLKERSYQSVVLCHQNDAKFVLSGSDFKQIGEEFGTQNVLYTVRTFPEKLTSPSGEQVFETHYGGVLYVMNRQMADVATMHNQWYMGAVMARINAEKDAKRPKQFAPDEEVF